jgi:hypothetical protein
MGAGDKNRARDLMIIKYNYQKRLAANEGFEKTLL